MAAALELVDEQGADALSMRSLAQRLGSGTATLYRHFADRAQLVAMVVDRMLGEVPVGDSVTAGLTWDEACVTFARGMFDALRRHGNAAPLLVGHIPLGPNAAARREYVLSALLGAGFTPQAAARTYATLSRYVLGFAMQAANGSASGDAEAADAFRRLDPGRHPATLAVADELPVPLTREFEFGLELMVSGLKHQDT